MHRQSRFVDTLYKSLALGTTGTGTNFCHENENHHNLIHKPLILRITIPWVSCRPCRPQAVCDHNRSVPSQSLVGVSWTLPPHPCLPPYANVAPSSSSASCISTSGDCSASFFDMSTHAPVESVCHRRCMRKKGRGGKEREEGTCSPRDCREPHQPSRQMRALRGDPVPTPFPRLQQTCHW